MNKPLNRSERLHGVALQARIGANLRRASQAMLKDFAESVKDHNISARQYHVLAWISENPGLNQSEVATATGMQRTNFAPLIEELESRGFVLRERADGRSNALSLTSKGFAMVRLLNRKIALHEAKYSALMSATEKRTLLSILQRIADYER